MSARRICQALNATHPQHPHPQAALEGVVAKRATSPYQAGRRSRFWVKTPIRNAACLVVGGWIPASAREGAVGSLLVGGHDDATGDLVYCGHITSGFSNRARRTLYELLTQIGCTDPPFTNIDPVSDESRAHWVHPVLVGRVEYREYTGRLRHAAWKGIEAADPATAQLPLADDNPRSSQHDHRYGQGRRAPRDCSRSSGSRRSSTIITVSGDMADRRRRQAKVPTHAPDPRRRLASIHVVSRTLRGA